MPTTRDSVAEIWGPRSPFFGEDRWPARVDERISETPDKWVQSACVLCSNGCALDIGVKDNRIVGVRGREADVVNRGRLGPKGLHGWEANGSADRLQRPLIRRRGGLRPASWNEAMTLIARRTKEIRDNYSAGAIGFYTTGQFFLEEYYTLGVIGKAGLGTPHMDGNTRLCTATAAAALKETFGADGQAGTYFDIDETDCIFHVGHNIAETDTVLWMRVLDRRRGPNPPRLIVVDPRRTPTAQEADLHLAPRLGTNVPLLNGLLHLLIEGGFADTEFIANRTIGFDKLKERTARWPPERVEEITKVPAADLRRAAQMIGSAQRLVSTCLQGVYQSNQATAAAVQVNNVNLILGRIGRPGCGILQMNGQPTAQNTRETGADGDLPGFRNWENPEHIAELARLWNVDPAIIPHWAPPTHALEIFRHCETGSIRMLWISGTNPAASLPDLHRIRKILGKAELFVVAQDAFMTETTALADVVLPGALWGEKTGCFTNVDRTVHISHQAVPPPGEARSDLDIFLDFARRMDFRDKDGKPLIKWSTPEEAFEAWKECSRGRPCDYTGLSYAKLSGGSGIPWPCNTAHPDGERRPYKTLQFPTDVEYCEAYGHDLITGASVPPEKYRAVNPAGRALLKAAEYVPPAEESDSEYPFFVTTGRVVYHFHTRTKTARSEELARAAPDSFVQISADDAARLSIQDGDWLRLTSRRGAAEARAAIGDIEPGLIFVPFHFGYWDAPGRARAANELTIYEWDAVSKQPHYKYAAVRLEKIAAPSTAQPVQVELRPDRHPPGLWKSLLAAMEDGFRHAKNAIVSSTARRHIPDYLGLLALAEERLARAFDQMRRTHPDEPDIAPMCLLFARWSREAAEMLRPAIARYGERSEGEPERLDKALLVQRQQGGFDLLRDLHDLWLLANESVISLTVLQQGAQALHDRELGEILRFIQERNGRQTAWLMTRIKQAAPQILVVPQK